MAHRRLPVYVAGQGVANSQVALRRFGIFLPTVCGLMPPPAEVRTLAQINTMFAVFCLLLPLGMPMFYWLIKKGLLAQLIPQYGIEMALAMNGQRVLVSHVRDRLGTE